MAVRAGLTRPISITGQRVSQIRPGTTGPTGIGRGEGPRRLFPRPFRQERDEGFSDWPAAQVSSQFLDVRPRTGKVGINFKRRLEGLECFPAVTKGELDETEPRERTEMAWLQGKCLFDVADRRGGKG